VEETMAIGRAIAQKLGKAIAAVGFVIRTSSRSRTADDPTITSGTAAPSATEPAGSTYYRVSATRLCKYVSLGGGAWRAISLAGVLIADPGDAAAIPVTYNGVCAMTTGSDGETGTLAIPATIDDELTLSLDVDGGGDRVVTAASAINAAGNTIMTFADAGDLIMLKAIQVGGVLAWRIVENEGVALS